MLVAIAGVVVCIAASAPLILANAGVVAVLAVLVGLVLLSGLMVIVLFVFLGILAPIMMSSTAQLSLIAISFYKRARWIMLAAVVLGYFPVAMLITDPATRLGAFVGPQYAIVQGLLVVAIGVMVVRARRRSESLAIPVLSSSALINGLVQAAPIAAYLCAVVSTLCWIGVLGFGNESLRPFAVALLGLAFLPGAVAVSWSAGPVEELMLGPYRTYLVDYLEDPRHPVMRWLEAPRHLP
jgi:hypothetical protein